jgi:hypothetical protein
MNGIPPIYILKKESIEDLSVLQNEKIVIVNKEPRLDSVDTFTQLFLQGGIGVEDIMAINGPAFTTLLKSDGHTELKNKLFITNTENYDIDTIVPEQIVFLTMFHHLHCMNYVKNETLSIQQPFTLRYPALVLNLVTGNVSTQTIFGVPAHVVVRFFDRVQSSLVDEMHRISFWEFVEKFKSDTTELQNYLDEAAQRFAGNNNSSVETLATHMTSNTRRGLDRISNPSFNTNNDDENLPEPVNGEVEMNRRSDRTQSVVVGSPSRGSALGRASAASSKAMPKKDERFAGMPGFRKPNAELASIASTPARTAVVPPAIPAQAPQPKSSGILPPAVEAALKSQAPRSKTRKHARFHRGNLAGAVEYSYNKNAPPSGVITNRENVEYGRRYQTYMHMRPLESRKKSSARPEPVISASKKTQ